MVQLISNAIKRYQERKRAKLIVRLTGMAQDLPLEFRDIEEQLFDQWDKAPKEDKDYAFGEWREFVEKVNRL